MLRQTLRRFACETGKAPFHPSSLGRLNHVAIAVPKTTTLEAAAKMYAGVLNAKISAPQHLPEHGVTTVFVELPNTKLELLHTLGDKSPIQGFLDKNPSGGMHHLCFEVDDLDASIKQVKEMGIRAIGEKKIGAHGKPVIFLHPKDCGGVLTELEQA